jgi:hypothetical protein
MLSGLPPLVAAGFLCPVRSSVLSHFHISVPRLSVCFTHLAWRISSIFFKILGTTYQTTRYHTINSNILQKLMSSGRGPQNICFVLWETSHICVRVGESGDEWTLPICGIYAVTPRNILIFNIFLITVNLLCFRRNSTRVPTSIGYDLRPLCLDGSSISSYSWWEKDGDEISVGNSFDLHSTYPPSRRRYAHPAHFEWINEWHLGSSPSGPDKPKH